MKHLVFIVNQRAGVNRNKIIAKHINRTLDKTKYTYEILETAYQKHGTVLAQQAAQKGAYGVIAVGGDGSVNDILKGLKNTNTILGIIPKGSGNGVARTLHIPLSIDKAIEIINRDQLKKVDVAYANDYAYLSNAGVGFDALIIDQFKNNKRRGFLSYCQIITQTIFFYKDKEWKITIDGKVMTKKAFFINIANGKQLGYGFEIAPDADCTDGLLDVTIVKKFPKLLGALIAIRLRMGTIQKSKYVITTKAKEVTIEASHLELLQTDGDPHPTEGKLHFKIDGKQKMFV